MTYPNEWHKWVNYNCARGLRSNQGVAFVWLKVSNCLRFPSGAYPSICCQLCQEFLHIFNSITILKLVKDKVDLVRVIECPRSQYQLCHLSRSEDWQGFGLKRRTSTRYQKAAIAKNCRKDASVREVKHTTTSLSTHTGEVGIEAFQICQCCESRENTKVCPHPLCTTIAGWHTARICKEDRNKDTGGMLHLFWLRIYYIESECLPLPDESFLERNGLMKWVKTACCLSLSMNDCRLLNTGTLKLEKSTFNVLPKQKLQEHPQCCLQWSNSSRICLHDLVSVAAEVLGAEAE